MEKDTQGSFVSENLQNILDSQRYWRGRCDVYKAVDQTKGKKYLIKEIGNMNEPDEQVELSAYMKIINSVEGKKQFNSECKEILTSNERKYLVFEKQGTSLQKWMEKQENVVNLSRIANILLQIIDISEFLHYQTSGQWCIANQIQQGLSFENDSVILQIPQFFRKQKDFKDHVYSSYVRALTEDSLFFYSPETLDQAGGFEIQDNFEYSDKADSWAVGILLYFLKDDPIQDIISLQDAEKRKEILKKQKEEPLTLNDLTVKLLEYNPVKRMSLGQLRENLLEIEKITKDKELEKVPRKSKQLGKVSKNKGSQRKEETLDNSGSRRDLSTDEENLWDIQKWNSQVIKKISQSMLPQTAQSEIYLAIKSCLESIMNFFQKEIITKQAQKLADKYEFEMLKDSSYRRAWLNPVSISLADFLASAESLARSIGKEVFAEQLLHAYGQIPKAFYSAKNKEKVLEFAEHALARDGKNIEAILMCAGIGFKMKSFNVTEKYISLAQTIEPNNPAVLFWSGKEKREFQHDESAALKFFNQCLDFAASDEKTDSDMGQEKFPYYPTKSRIPYELGISYHNLGMDDLSRESYEQYALLQPNDPNVYHCLGEYYVKLKNYEEGKKQYENQIRVCPNHSESCLRLFDLLERAGLGEQAIEVLERSQSENAFIRLIRIYENKGDDKNLQRVVETYEKYKKKYEDIANCAFTEGKQLLSQKKDSKQAINLFNTILSEFPKNSHLCLKIADIFLQQEGEDNSSEIIYLLKRSIQLTPEDIPSRFRLAYLYLKAGEIDQYRMELLEIIKLSPFHAQALFQLGKNDLLTKNKTNPLETLRFLKRCIRSCDRIPGIYGYLGIAYYKANKFSAALRCFEVSNRLKEKEDENLVQYAHAKCLLFSNRVSEANNIFYLLSSTPTFQKNFSFKFYRGICLLQLKDGRSSSTLAECVEGLTKVALKTSTIKIILQDLLNQMNNTEINQIKQKNVKFLIKTTDSDLCALLSESILVSRSHPQTAMHYVEQGLGSVRLFNSNEKDDTVLSPEVENNYGCRIQKAKIDFLIGRDPVGLIKELQEIKTAMVKAEEANGFALQGESSKQKKERIKYPPVNWRTCLDMLLVELHISVKDYTKADNILKKEIAKETNQKFERELAHWNAVIMMKKDLYFSQINLKKNKNYPPSCYLYGMECIRTGSEETLTALKKSLLKNTGNVLYQKAVADYLFDSGQLPASQPYYTSYYQEILAQNNLLKKIEKRRTGLAPRQIEFESEPLARLGEIFHQGGKIEEAIKILKISLDIDKNQPRAMLAYAKCFIGKKEFSEAKSFLDKILPQETKNPELYYLLGECNFGLGDYEMGKSLFLKTEQLDHNHYGALRGLGECNLKDNQLQQALDYFERCLKTNPKDERVLSGLSGYYLAKNQPDKAEEYLKKSLDVDSANQSNFNKLIQFYKDNTIIPNESYIYKFYNIFQLNKNILSYLGDVYFQAASTSCSYLPMSFKYYEYRTKLPEISGDDQYLVQLTNLRLAQISFYQKKFMDSLKLIRKFVVLKLPKDSTPEMISQSNIIKYDYYLLKAKIYLQLCRPEIPHQLLKCIKIYPTNEQSYFVFAFYLLQKGSQDAWRYFEKGMSLVKDKSSKREDILILQSLFALKDNKIEESKNILNECILAFSSSEVALFYLGNLHFEQQRYDQAQLSYLTVLSLESVSFLPSAACFVLSEEQKQTIHYQLAVSEAKTDEKSKAYHTCKKGLQAYPGNPKILGLLSKLQLEEGSSSEAFQSAQQSISFGSSDVQTYHVLALVSLRLSNTFSAILSLQKCLKIQPTYGQTQLKIGLIYESIARPKEALSYFLQYLAYFPNSLQALFRSSKLLAYFRSYTSAQSHVDRLYHELKQRNENENDKSSNIHNKTSSKLPVIEDKTLLEDQYISLSDAYAVQGYLFSQQNYLVQALVSYQEAFNLNKENKQIEESIAIIHRKLGNYKAEIKIYKSLLKSEQSSEEALKLTTNLGVAYKNANKLKKAIAVYEKANFEEFEENSLLLHANLGAFYIEQKSIDKAILALNQALDNERNHTESNFLLGIAYASKGDINAAARFYERSIKSNVCFFQAYLSLSAIKQKQGKLQEAVQICQSALEHCSSHKETILLQLGDLQLKSKDSWAALATFEQVLASRNDQDEPTGSMKVQQIKIACNVQIARVYRQLQEYEKSINHFKICLIISPDQPEYLHELGLIMLHKEDYVESLKLFKQAACANPKNATYLFSVATALHRLHQFELEIESLNECLGLKSSFKQNIYNNLALAYVSMNNTDKAIEIFKKSIKKYPEGTNLMYNLGNLFYSSKNLRQAVAMYENCLSIDPLHIGALNNLAVISIHLKEFQSAVDCFSKCLNIHPERKSIYSQKIMILQQRGYYPNLN